MAARQQLLPRCAAAAGLTTAVLPAKQLTDVDTRTLAGGGWLQGRCADELFAAVPEAGLLAYCCVLCISAMPWQGAGPAAFRRWFCILELLASDRGGTRTAEQNLVLSVGVCCAGC